MTLTTYLLLVPQTCHPGTPVVGLVVQAYVPGLQVMGPGRGVVG